MDPQAEIFTDEQRTTLVRLVMDEIARQPSPELAALLSRLSGTDTVLIAQRAYASRWPSPDDELRAAYLRWQAQNAR